MWMWQDFLSNVCCVQKDQKALPQDLQLDGPQAQISVREVRELLAELNASKALMQTFQMELRHRDEEVSALREALTEQVHHNRDPILDHQIARRRSHADKNRVMEDMHQDAYCGDKFPDQFGERLTDKLGDKLTDKLGDKLGGDTIVDKMGDKLPSDTMNKDYAEPQKEAEVSFAESANQRKSLGDWWLDGQRRPSARTDHTMTCRMDDESDAEFSGSEVADIWAAEGSPVAVPALEYAIGKLGSSSSGPPACSHDQWDVVKEKWESEKEMRAVKPRSSTDWYNDADTHPTGHTPRAPVPAMVQAGSSARQFSLV